MNLKDLFFPRKARKTRNKSVSCADLLGMAIYTAFLHHKYNGLQVNLAPSPVGEGWVRRIKAAAYPSLKGEGIGVHPIDRVVPF